MGQVVIKQIQFLSHQSKIASRLELLAYTSTNGVLPPPEQLESLKFKRIGYLSLDSNERSNYKALELKSVYINVPAYYLKICFMNFHPNKYNIYNQVSLMAINTLGEASTVTPKAQVDYAPLIEDSMQYDEITNQNLKRLYAAKEDAVARENFDKAKELKDTIDRLKIVGQQLKTLEDKKKQAIIKEDYESAKQINIQMDKIRKTVMVPIERDEAPSITKESEAFPYDKRLEMQENEPKEMPISGVTDSPGVNKFIKGQNKKLEEKKWEQEPPEEPEEKEIVDHNEEVIPAMKGGEKKEQPAEYEDGPQAQEENKEEVTAEQLTAASKKRAAPFMNLIDMPILQKLFSKVWTLREEALTTIQDEITNKEYKSFLVSDEGQVQGASIGIATELMSDKISQICLKSIDIIESVVKAGNLNDKSVSLYLEKGIFVVVEKLADTNQKVKERSGEVLDQICSSSDSGPSLVINVLCKANKKLTSVPIKTLQVKVDYLTKTISQYGIPPKSLTLIVEFGMATVKHSNNAVRNAAYLLFEELYKRMGKPLLDHLKELRPAQMDILMEHFRKINPEDDEQEEAKEEEKVTITTHIQPGGPKPKKMAKSKEEKRKTDEDIKCEFCGKIGNYTEEQMDMHLFKECPMLTICPGCMNVIEIIKLNEHMLTVCENKANYTKCKTCEEPIEKINLETHDQEGCEKVKPDSIRCPLCHDQLSPNTEEIWRDHIMVKQCPNNERFPN